MRKFKKAYVEITNVCNKNCSFCHGTRREKRFMTEAEFDRVLDELHGVTEYLYFHLLGEPLCHPRVMDFIEKAAKKGFKVTITTNGTLLTPELLDSGVYKVQISLHSFESGSENEREVYHDKIIEFYKLASEKNVLISLRLWNLGTNTSNESVERALETASPKPWREGRDGSFTLEKNVYLNYADRFEWPDMAADDNEEELFCYGLRDQIGILCDGTVVPCCMDAEGDIPLGNIFNQPIADIIDSPRAKAIYDGFSHRHATEELCRRCSYALRFK